MTNKIGQNPQGEEATAHGVDFPKESVPVRNSSKPHVPNKKYFNYLLLTDGGEPECYEETCQVKDASKWEFAMEDEMKPLVSDQTWKLAELRVGKKLYKRSGFIESRTSMMAPKDTMLD